MHQPAESRLDDTVSGNHFEPFNARLALDDLDIDSVVHAVLGDFGPGVGVGPRPWSLEPSRVFGPLACHSSFSESLSYTSTMSTLSVGQVGILTEMREPSIRMPARMAVAGSDML
ncbi:hypothetical protein [Streptomyces sp. NPDC001068]|uniref:hypothetical protein n=1 Tax=Streptomyces sp. NPDC001068 TaxID=3364544 RepID=UPI003691F57C